MSVQLPLISKLFKFFEDRIDPFPSVDPSMPPKGLWAFFRHYTKGSEKQLGILAFCSISLAIIEVGLFGAIGFLVDWMTKSTPGTFLQEYWFQLTAITLALLIILPIIIAIYSLVLHQGLLGNFPMRIRWLGHRYLLKQSVGFYAEDFAGRVATKLMQTALSLRDSVIKCCDVLLHISVYFVSVMILLAATDWLLALPILAWMITYGFILRYYLPRMKAISSKQAEARSTMSGRIVDAYSNIMTVKLFSHTSRETDYAQEAMKPFLDTVYEQMRLATGLQVCVQFSVYFTVFLEFAISIILWLNGFVSTGLIAVAIMVTMRLNGLSQWVMWEANMFFEHLGTVTDGQETLAKPLALEDKKSARQFDIKQGLIEFKDVSFHYGKGQGVIDHFNLNIQPGEKIGVVGRSGAGKSTLVNLLLRFYDVESGAVVIDGHPINEMTQESLRAHIGVVTQDTSLLHRTIRENIMYGRPDATEDELMEAIRKAQAEDFINTLSDQHGNTGLDALVGERGVKLSGGQRQRIAIARVLLKNAPILILDEATSALDSEVEQAIQSSLNMLMEGKTVIAIAHRLSTIAALDRLIVIDKGQIAEQGTHEELLQQKGIYAQLWSHQSGGFIGEDESETTGDA
ncbi:MAG: multidrug ABC transporter ATP-binding protein [Gammaproteobacteria bacterium]|nr:multidrug ABC transporter ATP-binding protein [Gammaproteobacteria bacterium]HBF08496.1 multidrug ABC transporter ATP-binding protein [Gammaproteobacteria bacterium]|tara:strand:+ start:20814 stop:22697 length:1884 start_codon:yes stop_codon:yes gene_type:complete